MSVVPLSASLTHTNSAPAPEIAGLKALHEAQWLRLALAHAGSAAYLWTPADDRINWSDGAMELLKVRDARTIATRTAFRRLMRADSARAFDAVLEGPHEPGLPFSLEYEIRTPGGGVAWIEDCGAPLLDENGKLQQIVGAIRVVTERKSREARLAHLASYDELTGHLTRSRLRESLEETVVRANTHGARAAYLVCGIDGLAAINESYGLDVADDIIVATGRRLASSLRADDLIGRVGGNKFGIILNGCKENDLAAAAERLREAVREHLIETRAGLVSSTVSVGAVTLPGGAASSEEAMIRAEEALGRAKASGRDNFLIYDHSPQRESGRRRNAVIGDQILAALRDNRLQLAYQPIVDARTGQVADYEALLRLLKIDGSPLPASEFIHVAEELGLIRLIDQRVLELAADALSQHEGFRLAVNVSGASVGDRGWLEAFDAKIKCRPEIARRMTVEVTETAALHDIDDCVRFVQHVREAGCGVAIDDFGAGYTSFRNLQVLPLTQVKIDGSFIKELSRRADNQGFVRTLVGLARMFDLKTVAEWVGTAEDARLLGEMGVDYLQGIHFGLPDLVPPWNRDVKVRAG
ncbi:MAG TPA: EAL domain-containing protein [Micropepsaceae bacterium]|nr:EAL domain-containing protein [Micropepsaceae bacterium]